MSQFVESVIPAVRAILAGADLDNITAKRVRKTLIAQGVDEAEIKAHKEELDERIQRIYLDLLPPQVDEEKPAPAAIHPPSSPAAHANGAPTSPHLPLARPAISKPKPATSTKPESDEAMARRLQAEFDAGLSGRASRVKRKVKPVKRAGGGKKKSADEVVSSGDEVEGEHEPKPKKRKRAVALDEDGEPKRASGGLQAPMVLSGPLSALVNETTLSRPQTVKAIWAHIRAHDLQDPADKRVIRCDEAMRAVFGCERMSMFQMNKLLSPHLAKPDEIQQ